MLRSCGFCSVKQVDKQGWRGIFHGDSPRWSSDVLDLVHSLGSQRVALAYEKETGCSLEGKEVVETLRKVSIPQFAAIKQRAFELNG